MIRQIFKENGGQNLVEYGLLAAVVALGSLAALNAFRTVINTAWIAISSKLAN